MSYKKRRKLKKPIDLFFAFFVGLTIFSMIFYQFAPLVVIRAEDVVVEDSNGAEEVEKETEKEESLKDDEEYSEEKEELEKEEKAEEEVEIKKEDVDIAEGDKFEEKGEETEETLVRNESEVIAEEESMQQKEADEPVELPSVGSVNTMENLAEELECECQKDNVEISLKQEECVERCSEKIIENTDDTKAENVVSSEANTGSNSVIDSNQAEKIEEDDFELEEVLEQEQLEPEIIKEDNIRSSSASEEESIDNFSKSEDEQALSEEAGADQLLITAIDTGDAEATISVVNEINTNIVTENGASSIQNIEEDYVGDINLLEAFEALLAKAGSIVSGGSLIVENKNSTDVSNVVSAVSNTGENIIVNDSENGDCRDGCLSAEIQTGDATAVANVINFINTNFVGNTWLFSAVNVLGSWTGNLIVPGAGLLSVPGGQIYSQTKVINENEASIENNIQAVSNTGTNEILGDGEAIIETGEANSEALVKNIVNTNIVKNNWFFLLINNMGSWMGNVINWNQETGSAETLYSYDFSPLGGVFPQIAEGSLLVHNQNSAQIRNDVSSIANTGGNSIIGDDGKAIIQTGSADSQAKVINFINTNVVGNNWLFGVVNIFGTWKGNVEFAYPDLDILMTNSKKDISPGESFSLNILYKNRGKAGANNTRIILALPEYLHYKSDDSGASPGSEGDGYVWDFSGLAPGEEKSFQVAVYLDDSVPQGVTALRSAAGISTETKEINLENNSSSTNNSVMTMNSEITIEQFDNDMDNLDTAKLKIEREDGASTAVTGNFLTHTIFLKNSGKQTIYNIEVEEKIKNPAGETIAKYIWNIEALEDGQQAIIDYQVFFGQSAMIGDYAHSAKALGYGYYGKKVESKKALAIISLSSVVRAIAATGGEVALAADVNDEEGMVPAVAGYLDMKEQPGNGWRDFFAKYWSWLALLLAIIIIEYFSFKREIIRKNPLV